MTGFFDSDHCVSRVHCKLCRNRDGGKDWRRSIRDAFDDIPCVQFDCPNGVPWGMRAPSKIDPKISAMGWDALRLGIHRLPEEQRKVGEALIDREMTSLFQAKCPSCKEASAKDKVRRWYAKCLDKTEPK